jgi:hypothetical protein
MHRRLRRALSSVSASAAPADTADAAGTTSDGMAAWALSVLLRGSASADAVPMQHLRTALKSAAATAAMDAEPLAALQSAAKAVAKQRRRTGGGDE